MSTTTTPSSPLTERELDVAEFASRRTLEALGAMILFGDNNALAIIASVITDPDFRTNMRDALNQSHLVNPKSLPC